MVAPKDVLCDHGDKHQKKACCMYAQIAPKTVNRFYPQS